MRLSSAGLAVLLLATLVATSSAAPATQCNCVAKKKNLRALSATGEEELVEEFEFDDDAGRALAATAQCKFQTVNCPQKKVTTGGVADCPKECGEKCENACSTKKKPEQKKKAEPVKVPPAAPANKPVPPAAPANKPVPTKQAAPPQIVTVPCSTKPGGKCWGSCPGEEYPHGTCSDKGHKCCKVLCEHNGGVCKQDCAKKCDKLVKQLGMGTYWSANQCSAEPDRGLCNTQGEVCCSARRANSDDINDWNKKNEPIPDAPFAPTEATKPGACIVCPKSSGYDKPGKTKTCKEQNGICGPNVSDTCRRAAKLVKEKYVGDFKCGTISASDCEVDESCIQHSVTPKPASPPSRPASDDRHSSNSGSSSDNSSSE